MMRSVVVFLVFVVVWGERVRGDCDFCGPFPVTADTLPDYIGQNPFPFNSSTGYVVVNTTYQRNNFYWLTESQGPTPESDPLIFWYQGGPGCSGLGGLFTEHGPFHVNLDGTVDLSQITWTSFANIVYLEQPTSVGFSYSGQQGYEYSIDDFQAAADNYNFIEGFLEANPRFIGRPTWLAGESYGGVYIPMLTNQILNHPDSNIYKQLIGTMNGNPVFDCNSLTNSKDIQINIYYWHQLISQSTIDDWNSNGCAQSSASQTCQNIYSTADKEVGKIYQEIGPFHFNGTQPSLDTDDLFQDFITGNGTLDFAVSLEENEPTGDQALETYLSRSDVQAAIHAHAPVSSNGDWDFCDNGVLHYHADHGSLIPYYQSLFSQRPDVHVLVYSGDVDMATVPGPYTTFCLKELDGTLTKEWGPWFVNGATVGYVEQYDQYSYATVKGAGHTVPTYMPLAAFNMAQRFVQKQNLDGGEVYFHDTVRQKKRKRILKQSDMLRHYGIGPFAPMN